MDIKRTKIVIKSTAHLKVVEDFIIANGAWYVEHRPPFYTRLNSLGTVNWVYVGREGRVSYSSSKDTEPYYKELTINTRWI